MTDRRTAAVYLRMSTEHQQYSLDNQNAAIAVYAEEHSFTIVKTYTDGARSGVVLKRRDGLRQLLKDVVSGEAGFQGILVYDVSRWGRFQDADEAAHYEFICKQAGVPVHYCAESFVNDGAIQNMLMKALKRTMAGEYSRELGIKVLAGLKRLAKLGFKQGGLPGYGLRRMLVSSEGLPKQFLGPGERKSIANERVILVPGPENEVKIVHDIFRMFVEDRMTVYAIACGLNRRGVPYGESRWSHQTVQQILSHPKYAGCNVFGRTSQKLGTPSVRMPERDWLRTPGAFIPLIPEELSREAQRLLLDRTINKSDDNLLDALRRLLAREGRLSLSLIRECESTPSPSTYRKRFGSLRRAYELIGYGKLSDFGPIDLRRRTQSIREHLLEEICAASLDKVKIVRKGGRRRSVLRLLNGRVVSVLVAHSTKSTQLIWQIDPVQSELRQVTLVALLNKDNNSIQELRLFKHPLRNRRFNVTTGNVWLDTGLKLEDLFKFSDSVAQVARR